MKKTIFDLKTQTRVSKHLIQIMDLDNFDQMMLNSSIPVLVVCLRNNEACQEQLNIIESVAARYHNKITGYVVAEELVPQFCQRFNVKGTPTFLFLLQGREMDRMLGSTDRESLSDFIDRKRPDNL